MKKFIILLLCGMIAATGYSQLTMTQTDPAGATATVNTNDDTSYHTLDLAGDVYNYDIISIALRGVKNSGTISGGSCVPYGSMDGSNWFQLYGKTNSSMAVDTTSSRTLTDGSHDFVWHFDKTRWRYYRIRVITTGTQSSTYTCRLLGRKVANR